MVLKNIYSIAKLKGSENYDSWTAEISSLLKREGLWDTTIGRSPTPALSPEQAEAAICADKNDRACGTIMLASGEGPRAYIERIEDAKTMWEVLRKRYKQSDFTTRHLAVRYLCQAQQSDFTSIAEYAASIKSAAAKCAGTGSEYEIPRLILNCIFVNGLGEGLEFYALRLMRCAETEGDELDIDAMVVALVGYEKRCSREDILHSSKARRTKHRDEGHKDREDEQNSSDSEGEDEEPCKHCNRGVHSERKCWDLYPEHAPRWFKNISRRKRIAGEVSRGRIGLGSRAVRSM